MLEASIKITGFGFSVSLHKILTGLPEFLTQYRIDYDDRPSTVYVQFSFSNAERKYLILWFWATGRQIRLLDARRVQQTRFHSDCGLRYRSIHAGLRGKGVLTASAQVSAKTRNTRMHTYTTIPGFSYRAHLLSCDDDSASIKITRCTDRLLTVLQALPIAEAGLSAVAILGSGDHFPRS